MQSQFFVNHEKEAQPIFFSVHQLDGHKRGFYFKSFSLV